MQRHKLFVASDYLQRDQTTFTSATLINATLDYTVNASVYGHPAVIPERVVASTQSETGDRIVGQTANVGTNRAVIATFNVTSDTLGVITLLFTATVGAAALNGLEVLTQEATPQGAARINCGGSAVGVWAADTGFTGGTTFTTATAIDTLSVSAPAPQAVYQSWRTGMSAYTVSGLHSVTTYTVRLHYAEIAGAAVGARVFGVVGNGANLGVGFDIRATATYAAITPNTGSTWVAQGAFAVSTKLGDMLTLTTAAYAVTVQLTGVLSSGSGAVSGAGSASNSIRNGATASIFVDGVFIESIATYGVNPKIPIYLFDGLTHTIAITYSANPVGVTLQAGDTFMLAIASVSFGTGLGGTGGAALQTAVYDGGDPNTQPIVAEWMQNTPLASVTVAVGSTPVPDATWRSVTTKGAQLGVAIAGDGTQYGTAPLLAAGPGRYCQLTFTLAGTAGGPEWMRDVAFYTWVQATDPVASRITVGYGVTMGPSLATVVATLATMSCDRYQDAQQLLASGTVGNATDLYMQGYLRDLNLVQVTGEQPETAQARARALLSSPGLTIASITKQLDALVHGFTDNTPPALSGGPGSLSAQKGGTSLTQIAANTYQVIIQPGLYNGMPGLKPGSPSDPTTAQGIIYAAVTGYLAPVGSIIAGHVSFDGGLTFA